MPVFLVTPLAHNADQIGAAVKRVFDAENRFELQDRAGWFVVHPGTTVEVSNALGITSDSKEPRPDAPGSAMVTLVASYYGRGSTTMWEWLKTRFER